MHRISPATDGLPRLGGSSTILVVDDEPANLAVLTEILQPLFTVRAATSGERALRVAVSDPRPERRSRWRHGSWRWRTCLTT